jgi:hypothetical protein
MLSQAVEPTPYITESGIEVQPVLAASYQYNDNITHVSEAEIPISSPLLEVTPGLALKAERGENIYELKYALTSGTYSDSSGDNYLDHQFASNNFFRFNLRHALQLDYSYFYLHEDRGIGLAAGDVNSTEISEPLRYDSHHINSIYVYGAEEAKGRIEASIGFSNRTYKNYRNITGINAYQSSRFNDFDEMRYDLIFFYNIFSTSDLIFEIEKLDRRYDYVFETSIEQDSDTHFLYAGAQWDITGKTKGSVKLGYQDKQFKDSRRKDFGGFSWRVALEWTPSEYSTVIFTTSQVAKDPDQAGDYVDEKRYQASWKHYWLPLIYTNFNLAKIDEDYTGDVRTEDTIKTAVTLGYEMKEWVELSASWKTEEKESSKATYSYDQDIWSIDANIAF